MKKVISAAAASLGVLLSGCAWLPAAGPTTSQVIDGADEKGVQRYTIVDVTPQIVATLAQQSTTSFQRLFGSDKIPPVQNISVGDSLAISVWEAGAGSLFVAPIPLTVANEPGSHAASIPEQIVLADGTIFVPFVGRITVAGKTAQEVQDQVRRVLVGKAADPQILVSILKSPANTVTVTGEVASGARVHLSPKGDRILEVLASVGGIKSPLEETSVRLTRSGVTATLPVSNLLEIPTENVILWPGDILTVVHQSQYFVAFGATGRNAEIPINGRSVNLAQAIGKIAGLLDDRADSSGVFLLRYEPQGVATKIGAASTLAGDAIVPIVYRFDLKNLQSYFLAQQFAIINKDVIYVANSNSNTLQKFFQLLGTLTSPVSTGAVVNANVH